MNGAPADILMVEDNDGDVFLAMEALKEANIVRQVHVVHDGVEAMQFLRRQGKYARSPRPDLVLLDLNLPRMDGREVLVDLKSDPDLRRTPVVVLSSSQAEQDVQEAYDLHANCYIAKPVDFNGMVDVAKRIEAFWFRLVRLPPA